MNTTIQVPKVALNFKSQKLIKNEKISQKKIYNNAKKTLVFDLKERIEEFAFHFDFTEIKQNTPVLE